MTKYYILKAYGSFVSDVFEVDFDTSMIRSLSFILLDKYKAKLKAEDSLLPQIASAYFGNGNNDYEEEKESFNIFEYTIRPGHYFPRIYRPIINDSQLIKNRKCNNCTNIDNIQEKYYYEKMTKVIDYKNEFIALTERVYSISRIMSFDENNFSCYGSAIRSEIIMINTEIEAQMKGILKENGYLKEIYTTNDYARLLSIMKLNEYSLILKDFPNIPELQPYMNWSMDNPTKSLEWLVAYNKLKHDKYSNMNISTLKNMIDSFSALIILLYAQFSNFHELTTQLNLVSKINKSPQWTSTERYFYFKTWKEKKYFEET